MKMSERFYRLTVLLLTIILVLTILPTAKNYYYKYQRINNNENLVITTKANGNIEVINTIDDTTLKVKYAKDVDKYTLYRDEIAYDLSTQKYGDNLVIDLAQTDPQNYDGVVVGQFAFAIPLILWTPALIEAAQITIAAAVAVVGTYTVWYSVDSIAKTIDANKVNVKVQEKVEEKEDTKKNSPYYSAALAGGVVVINKQITYEAAVARLIAGMDVFATTREAAKAAALAATVPTTKYIYHKAHDVGEGFYPHYHPGGRKWIVNPNHEPHCWFGATQ
ncbi:MAG: hypothetical protein K0R72_432 [Clostridia bacterium]|jgi:hypothetical protein|nr:hypothetical protein [Clostridia bacterium]